MTRISPIERSDPRAAATIAEMEAAHGRATNMKRTLARSPVALRALLTWYELRAEVVSFLGERGTNLFAHAVSTTNNCLVCSTFFRRLFIDSGEDPDNLILNDLDNAIVSYGHQLASDPNAVGDELYERLAGLFSDEQIVTLTAFAGLMVATNLFNNALRVDLDDYLQPYRKQAGT